MTLGHLGHLILHFGFLNGQASRTEFGEGSDESETQKSHETRT